MAREFLVDLSGINLDRVEMGIEEIRKYNPDIPITLCTEAADMWQEFAPLLDRNPASFVCGCGPMTIPGLKRLPKNPWTTPEPVSVWAAL